MSETTVMEFVAPPATDRFLLAAAAIDATAALLHLACIPLGGPAYLALGAGERMAQLAEAGHPYPTIMATAIASVLSVWALYALSGAGVIRRLPLLRTVLCSIAAVFLLRGVGLVVLMPYFPGNSMTFWIASSAVCLVIGLVHAAGVRRIVPRVA